MSTQTKNQKRSRLKARIRARVRGTTDVPRLSVYRSNNFIYAQVIDDQNGKTLASASDRSVKKGTKTERAEQVGTLVAEAAKAKKITRVVFDRNGFRYTGRVKRLADAARNNGLTF